MFAGAVERGEPEMKISEYKEEAMKTVKNYTSDLDIDIATMNSGIPYLFFLRENGSHKVGLTPFEHYPPAGVTLPYLFGTVDRQHLLNEARVILDFSIRNGNTKHILYFNGKEVLRVTLDEATELIETYMSDMQEQFSKNP
jgi:hypothetical protein